MTTHKTQAGQQEARADEAENVAGELWWRLGEAEAKNNFYESMVGAYPGLIFRVVRAERCDVNNAELKEKFRNAIGLLQKEGCKEDEIKPKTVFYTAQYHDETPPEGGEFTYQEGEREILDEKYARRLEKITGEGFHHEIHPTGSSIPRKVRHPTPSPNLRHNPSPSLTLTLTPTLGLTLTLTLTLIDSRASLGRSGTGRSATRAKGSTSTSMPTTPFLIS